MTFKIGDKVRLNRAARTAMFWQKVTYGDGRQEGYALREHVREFRRSVGIIEGPAYADTDEFLDVRWIPKDKSWKGLKYAYRPDQLELVE